MFNLDGALRERLIYEPDKFHSSLSLTNEHKELLYYVTCFGLADRKLSRKEMEEQAQEVANHVLQFYIRFNEPIDQYYKAKHMEHFSNFLIADKIFEMMKKREEIDTKETTVAPRDVPASQPL